jgi:hypothetical protein
MAEESSDSATNNYPSMSTIEIKDPEFLRKRWFDQPLSVIENGGQIPDGNGAIIALMAVFPLYERYWCAQPGYSKATRWKILANITGLNDTTKAEMFWNVFRDGLLHRGMPFENSERARKPLKKWALPKVNLGSQHPPLPVYGLSTKGEQVICLNPWGFVQHVLAKYRADPGLLTRDTDSPLLLLSLVVPEEVQPPRPV